MSEMNSNDLVIARYQDESKTLKKKVHYQTIEEYCLDVSDSLPQRQAFYTLDLADVLFKIQHWKEKLPNVEIFYAVKANCDPVLLKLLVLQGISFDCASKIEIRMLLGMGAAPSNIIFANTIKTPEDLRYAAEVGVDLMTFDNKAELLKIHRFYKDARLVLRVIPLAVKCSFDLSIKFGCTEDEAEELLKLAKDLDMNVAGLAFHVGSMCRGPLSFELTIEMCRRIADIATSMGFEISILDIGGGFLGQIGTDDTFDQMADLIQKAVRRNFPESNLVLIGEPGCFIVASAGRLVTTIIGKKVHKNNNLNSIAINYYLNDGIHGSFFREIELYDIKMNVLTKKYRSNPQLFNCRLFGQTCYSMDIIRQRTQLPDLQVGDRLLWENMGAYSQYMGSSSFCGMLKPLSRCVFLGNNRLNLDQIENKEVTMSFIKEHATAIDCDLDSFR